MKPQQKGYKKILMTLKVISKKFINNTCCIIFSVNHVFQKAILLHQRAQQEQQELHPFS
jgi:hypothetical protein